MQAWHLGVEKHGRNRFGEALQPINHGNEDIGHAAFAQFGHDPQPKLGALGLLDPQAEHFPG